MIHKIVAATIGSLVLSTCAVVVRADDQAVSLADGRLTMTAPESWEKREPRTRILDYEFAAPAAGEDEAGARITVMGAGGSVQANIDRWLGQFEQPDGRPTRERATIEQLEVNGQEVHLVDISGRYRDQPGPFAPAVIRDDYRMLGAIIVTEGIGQYFVRMYGPKQTVAENVDAFREMVDSLKVNDE